MIRLSALTLTLGAALALAAQAATPLISRHGAGPVRIGMTFDQVRPFADMAVGDGGDPAQCAQGHVKGYPDLDFLVENNRVTRVTTHGRGLQTPEGIQVGDREDMVRAAYGRKLKSYKPEFAEGHVLYAMQTPTSGIVFWLHTDGRVAAIHAGDGESIRYYEGCG